MELQAIPKETASEGDSQTLSTQVTVVVATRNRLPDLLATLRRIEALPERPRVVVVDNGSVDGTPQRVRTRHRDVHVVGLGRNLGAGARTVGVRHARTPYVAFSDDDSWWEPGALTRAVRAFEAHPRLGLVAARVLVGPDQRLDPVCSVMASSPLGPDPSLPGPPVLGFVTCGSIVRRSAFLEVKGFDSRLGIGGEELALAIELAAAGWGLAYLEEVVAHHHPSPVSRDRPGRRRQVVRNDLLVTWLRRPLPSALRATVRTMASSFRDPDARAALADAARHLPWVARERRVVAPELERDLRTLEAQAGSSG